MWLEVASLGYLLADHVYHRLTDKHEGKHREAREVEAPRVDEGSPVPLIYGRCRVRSPVVADIRLTNVVDDVALFDIMMVLGIGMDDGQGTTRVLDMWSGDKRAVSSNNVFTDDDGLVKWAQTGDGGPETVVTVAIEDAGEGRVETLNGNPSQVLANDGDTNTTAPTNAGRRMLTTQSTPARSLAEIPGFRGYVCAFLFEFGDGSGWRLGGPNVGNVPAYSFEVSSYQDGNSYPATGIMARIGQDSNPVNVLYDLLKARFGKLGISTNYIDLDSFGVAATTLYGESHGYSRAIEDVKDLGEHIQEILEQIDGVLYWDPGVGKLKLKLIRSDYDPNTIPHITKENCSGLEGFAIGGWTDTPNAVRVVYTNRSRDYADDSEIAQDNATAVGQDGEVRWKVISMPGVTHSGLAYAIARRELAWCSRPLMKCRAIVDRSLIRVAPGDAVRLTYQKPDISGIIFRVASVSRGTLADGKIALQLIQDVSYSYRGRVPEPPWPGNDQVNEGPGGIGLGS